MFQRWKHISYAHIQKKTKNVYLSKLKEGKKILKFQIIRQIVIEKKGKVHSLVYLRVVENMEI